MTQTIGAGGGKATRQYSGNLYRILRKEDFDRGIIYVADYLKCEAEFNQIFNNIAFADPTVTSSNPNGNFAGAAMIGAFTTPSATGKTAVINHALGRVPVGWLSIGPAATSGQNVTWAQVQAPDTNNLYLKLVHSEDVSVTTSLIVW